MVMMMIMTMMMTTTGVSERVFYGEDEKNEETSSRDHDVFIFNII